MVSPLFILVRCKLISGLEPLTAFDGMVGAVIDEGRHFITSPRTNYIYMPPLGTRTVTLRKDFRYGEDDFIQWPQPYSVASCHFMCIPRRPQNESDDPLDRLWWTPGFDGFESNGSTLSTAIGKVVWYSLQELKKATDTVLDRARKFLRSNICKPTHRTHVSLMVTTIHNTLCRLEFIPTTRREAFIGVATVQRNALELLGYIDYMQVYLPRITGEHPPATSVGHLVGTFTADPAVVQECVAAGVPVWHIRQWMELEHTRVDALVKPISPESLIIIDQAEPPFCPAYVGSAFAFDKIVAIRNQMDSFTRYPNPFAVSASQVRNVTESLGSVGAPPAQGGGKSVEGTTHLQRGGSSRVGKAGKAARPMPCK
jgi:hypothetical protein